ncbi:PorV/PorQ family protein [candidate division WOR-3 bacterium]|nr:PorV/PorQ family protein [candidate division WOR-3 bacterium]
MFKRIIFLLVIAGVFPTIKGADASFLLIWPGSRPAALGGAFTAIADDASAALYNPAGLGFQKDMNLLLMHANWLPDLYPGMYFEYLAASASIPKVGTFAFNGVYLSTGECIVTDGSGNLIGSYTTFDYSLGVAYGRELNPKLSIGGGIKLIYDSVAPDWVFEELGITGSGSGLTWAVDAGVLYKPFQNLKMGVAMQNLGPPISFDFDTTSTTLPLLLRTGIGFNPTFGVVNDRALSIGVTLCPACDFVKLLPNMFTVDPSYIDTMTFGQELAYELEDIWRSFGLEASGLVKLILPKDWSIFGKLTLDGGYFFDKHNSRGGFVVEDETRDWIHVGLFPFIFGKQEGKLIKAGLTFGGYVGLGFETSKFRLGLDLGMGSDENLLDFPTTNRRFSGNLYFQPLKKPHSP